MQTSTTTPAPSTGDTTCKHLRFHTDVNIDIGFGPLTGQWFATLTQRCTDCGKRFGIVGPDDKVIFAPKFPIAPVDAADPMQSFQSSVPSNYA